MLKWTVQQKRHKANVAADSEPDERDSGSADGTSCNSGSRSSSRSNSGDCGGEQQEQQQQVACAFDSHLIGECSSTGETVCTLMSPVGSAPTDPAVYQRLAAHCEAEQRLYTVTRDVDDAAAADLGASSAPFMRRPSIRQPRGRNARPLSLNLEAFYACDRPAIPLKAKALLGIDERPRTPVVAAASAAVGHLDGVSVSPKALAVLGITSAEQQTQQQQHRQPRNSQHRRRSPAGGPLQQISEGSPVCDGPDASSSRAELCSSSNFIASSGSTANGRIASAESALAARNDAGSRNGRRDKADGLPPSGSNVVGCRSISPLGVRDDRSAAASAEHDVDRSRVDFSSPLTATTTSHLTKQQQRAERLNEAVEVVAARPKVARRRPLKHSRRESPADCHTLEGDSAEPDDDSSSSSSCSGGGGFVCDSLAPDRMLPAPLSRCGSCTPDSGVGGEQHIGSAVSAETDSPSDYDDDDAVAAWRQPHPKLPPPGAGVGGCSCAELRPTPPLLAMTPLPRVAVRVPSPPLPLLPARPLPLMPRASLGTQSDFIDMDVHARSVPLSRLPSAAAVACVSHRTPGDRRPREARTDDRLAPEASCSNRDAYRRGHQLSPPSQYPLQHQPRMVARTPSPVCGGRVSPSLGLRHAHSDPASSWRPRTASDALTQACAHDPESPRWAAVKTTEGSYQQQYIHLLGSSRNERGHQQQQQQQDRATERQAAMAAYRKTVHVYC